MKTIYSLLIIALTFGSFPLLVQGANQTPDKQSSIAPASDDFLIVPGQRIGNVCIGESQKDVHQTLGAFSSMLMMGPLGTESEGYKSGFGVSYVNFKVVEINISSKQFKTQNGVSVGSSPDLIRKLFKGGVLSVRKVDFGTQHKTTKTLTYYIYTDAKRGIQFQFGNNEKHSTKWCDTITIMKPAS
ncbi:MAG: hypothetical protein ABI210_07235 [Abditibacteriaceae bacterium]